MDIFWDCAMNYFDNNQVDYVTRLNGGLGIHNLERKSKSLNFISFFPFFVLLFFHCNIALSLENSSIFN